MSQQRQHILLSEVEGKPAVCFDTGLEPRSFARTKMSQSLIEKGYTVNPDGTHEVWTSSGVCEFETHMRVWGKHFPGERFDAILNFDASNEEQAQKAIKAVGHWIKAKTILGDIYSTLNPSATFISPEGGVFFSPPNLANRCLHVEGKEIDYYNCPDLTGMDAVAFCAAAMLYKILAKTLPYTNITTIYQDMREGVFQPPRFAAPGLNKELSGYIESALLLPVEKKSRMEKKNAQDILAGMLALLSAPSLFNELSPEEKQEQEKEKKRYLLKQKVLVKTRRFAVKNKYPLWGAGFVLAFIVFMVFSTLDGIRNRPTTEGMAPDSVVLTYYDSFSNLDHDFMSACVQGSDSTIKTDINAATSYYAIVKTRQVYANAATSPIVPAKMWRDNGGELPAPDVFGVTDLTIEHLAGNERDKMIIFRVNYQLWAPNEYARKRTDTLTLQRDKKKNWRIIEILRTEY